MKTRKTILFLSVLTLLIGGLSLNSKIAAACTCPEPNEALSTEYYESMDLVFEGEVLTVSKDGLQHTPKVLMKIKRQYKGTFETSEIYFDFNANQYLCGFDFKEGQLVTLGAYALDNKPPRIAFNCAQMGVRKYLIMQGGYPR